VFRIAGAKNRMIELTEGLNSGTISNFNKDEPAGVIPGLLKQFLRELPEPLLTYEEFDAVRSIAGTLSASRSHVSSSPRSGG